LGRGRKLRGEEEARRLELYRRGLTDGEMARILGVRSGAVTRWRKRRGLRANLDARVRTAAREILARYGLPAEWEEKVAEAYGRYREGRKMAGGLWRIVELDVMSLIQLLCRRHRVPTPEEIARATTRRYGGHRRWSGYMHALRVLDGVSPSTPMDYVRRFAEAEHISARELEEAGRLLDGLSRWVLMGKNPRALAAAALYAALRRGSRYTQRRVAEALGVTEVALRNYWRTFFRGELRDG
jgi:transcription initiation factor TFIIIB Brf1 subunit/transcription initiation factor TFIIB